MSKPIDAQLTDKELRNYLEELSIRISKMKKGHKNYLKLITPIAYKDVMKHFENEEGPKGSWDSWSDSYHKFLKRKNLSGNQILNYSNRLRRSVIPAAGGRSKDSNIVLLLNKAKTKDGFPYALHHDTGKSSSKGNPRTFFWLSDKAIDEIAYTSLEYMDQTSKKR